MCILSLYIRAPSISIKYIYVIPSIYKYVSISKNLYLYKNICIFYVSL